MKQKLLKLIAAFFIITFCVGYAYIYIQDNEVSKVSQAQPVNNNLTAKK